MLKPLVLEEEVTEKLLDVSSKLLLCKLLHLWYVICAFFPPEEMF